MQAGLLTRPGIVILRYQVQVPAELLVQVRQIQQVVTATDHLNLSLIVTQQHHSQNGRHRWHRHGFRLGGNGGFFKQFPDRTGHFHAVLPPPLLGYLFSRLPVLVLWLIGCRITGPDSRF